jgi:hypothetical protein
METQSVVIKESIKLITFTADAEIAERESLLICPEKYSGQIKSSQPFRHVYGRRPGASGESASHRFSRKNTLSQRPLRLERVTPSRDEWAVKRGVEDVN